MSYLLHIETATDVCSVALSEDDKLLYIDEHSGSLRHSEIISLQISKVLSEVSLPLSKLAAVSLSEGPGSYTSLRVGMSAAKAICYAHDLPLIAVNTLLSLAESTKKLYTDDKYIYCAMIDARRMEVYASIYARDMSVLLDNKALILEEETFDKYIGKDKIMVFSGNGATKAKTLYKGKRFVYTDMVCSAQNLINTAYNKYQNKEFVDLAYFSPNYIKAPNITTPKVKML